MENSTKASRKFICLSDFSSCINRLTLRFKDPLIEREYPTKSIRPLNVTVLFKVLFYTIIICIGLRRLEMLLLTFANHSLIVGAKTEEIINFSLFAAAVVLETIVYSCKRLRLIRGLFMMTYMYFSTAFTSHYIDRNALFSVTM
eukprot:TRINITY_DN4864_c0_g5_i1.p1 TRINITY_DN4864_c0_g5~~TRINITY_DN4864_c0_g5_i1.p1  ORF type:complete len:144 (-),score=47.13 TRINITY_DN4864_c0_g5_i1:202-633(-)